VAAPLPVPFFEHGWSRWNTPAKRICTSELGPKLSPHSPHSPTLLPGRPVIRGKWGMTGMFAASAGSGAISQLSLPPSLAQLGNVRIGGDVPCRRWQGRCVFRSAGHPSRRPYTVTEALLEPVTRQTSYV
jgi:hypothetical protein